MGGDRATSSIRRFTFVVLACVAATLAGTEQSARASILDAGVQAGVATRNLSDIDYKPAFVWQLHAELALIPPVLMLGPYLTVSKAAPNVKTQNAPPSGIDFTSLGLHAKVKIPLPGTFKPYGLIGAGWVHGNFPQETLALCRTVKDANGTPTDVCEPPQKFPAATSDFVEFPVGGGFVWTIAEPLAITGEINWRPSIGYKNDVYQKQLNAGSTSIPNPSGNGTSWTFMLGMDITI